MVKKEKTESGWWVCYKFIRLNQRSINLKAFKSKKRKSTFLNPNPVVPPHDRTEPNEMDKTIHINQIKPDARHL